MKNGILRIFVTALLSILLTFVVMWFTLGANAASKQDLKVVEIELKAENALLESKLNSRLVDLSALVAQNVAAVNKLVGYIEATKNQKDRTSNKEN